MSPDNPNYCQHPECHSRHVGYYADYYGTRSSGDTSPWLPVGKWHSFWPQPGWRRWCRSHALLIEGVSFG